MVNYIRYPLISLELDPQAEIASDDGQVWDQSVQVVSQQDHRKLQDIRSNV